MQVVHSGVLVDTEAYHASMTMFVEITGCHEDVSACVQAVPRDDVSVCQTVDVSVKRTP